MTSAGTPPAARRGVLAFFRHRLVLVFLGLGVCSLVAVSIASVILASGTFQQQTDDHLRQAAALSALYVRQQMTDVGELLQSYAQQPSLITSMGDGDPRHYDLQTLNALLSQLNANRGEIVASGITDSSGTIAAINPPNGQLLGQNFAFRDWYRGVIRSGKPYVSEAYASALPGHPLVVAVASPIYGNATGQPLLGLLTTTISLRTIAGFTDQFAKVQGLSMTVTDQRGVIVGATGQPATAIVSLRADPGIASALQGRSGSFQQLTPAGRVLSAYSPVPGIGWAVEATMPAGAAFAPVVRLGLTVLGIALAFGIVFLLGGWLLHRVLVQREKDGQELRRLNADLARQAAERESVLMNIADGVVTIDRTGKITPNPAAERIMGMGIVEMPPAEWTEAYGLFLPDQVTPYPAPDLPMARAMRGEAVDDVELFVRHPGVPAGATISVTARPLRDQANQLNGAVAVFRDITIRKRTEVALARLAAIVESSDDAIIGKDLSGTILSWNRGAEHLYGYTAGEVIGQNISILVPPDRLDELSGMLERVRRGESTDHLDFVRLRKGGARLDVSVTVSPIKDASGKVIGGSAIARDVTERRRAEEEIRVLNADLERRVAQRTAELEVSNKELEAFTYTVSHDLRAPLRGIDGFVGILLRKNAAQLDEDGRHSLERVSKNAQQMGQLIDGLLAFSRLSRQTLQKRSIQVGQLIDGALDQLRPQLEARRVEIAVSEMPVIQCEPTLMQQVFTNLIGNAIKYSRHQEIAQIEIGVNQAGSSEEAVFFVKDNGAGFDMRYVDKLFGVFQRLHGADEYEGTGVGLAIVRRIIERHGGRVWAQGEPDRGATFYFTVGGIAEWTQAAA